MRHVVPVDFAKFPSGFHSERLATPQTGMDSCIAICSRVPPGHHGPKLHTHPADQFYYVMSGEMNLQLGTDTFTVGPETLVFIPQGTPHCNWNTTDKEEVHFEFIVPAPPEGVPLVAAAEPRKVPDAASLIRPLKRDAFAAGGFAVQQLAGRKSGSNNVAFNIAQVQPGGSGPDSHIHTFDQLYYVIEGTMQVEVGLKRYQAGPHTLVVLPAGVVHRNWNEGPGVERHIALLVPEHKEGEPVAYPTKIDRQSTYPG
jgi:mannose-6-phosphate isomerase-like protein (cupin superfamily)